MMCVLNKGMTARTKLGSEPKSSACSLGIACDSCAHDGTWISVCHPMVITGLSQGYYRVIIGSYYRELLGLFEDYHSGSCIYNI